MQCFDDLGQTLYAVASQWDDLHELPQLLELHPDCLNDLPTDAEQAKQFTQQWCPEMSQSDKIGSVVQQHADVLVHLAVKMTMNAFSSGVYLYISMLNHSCQSNCEVRFET